jgi:hypothetical protein
VRQIEQLPRCAFLSGAWIDQTPRVHTLNPVYVKNSSAIRTAATELIRERVQEHHIPDRSLEKMPVQCIQQPEPMREISHGNGFGPSL